MLAVAALLISCALAIGFVFKKVFADQATHSADPAAVAAVPQLQTVPVALTDILPGTAIQPEYLAEAPILSSTVNRHRDTVKSPNVLIGRIAKETIPAASPLRLSMLHPIGATPSVRIAEGHRLVGVEIDDDSMMIGHVIKPGSHVDVLMTIDSHNLAPTVEQPPVVQLFTAVKVSAIGTYSPETQSTPQRQVLLEVRPDHQKVLVFAKQHGRLTLTCNPQRSDDDRADAEKSDSGDISLSDLALLTKHAVRSQQSRPVSVSNTPFSTEQYRNGKAIKVYYDQSGAVTRLPE